MDHELAREIEASRQEIEKLQHRVRQLVSRRGKRAELVKSAGILTNPEPPPAMPAQKSKITRTRKVELEAALPPVDHEFTLDQAMIALKTTTMEEVRLIAFNHGNVVLLFADDRTVTVKMDERGPKPLFDLLTANDEKKKAAPSKK